jgi:large subunit ribosomal protein L23
MALFSAKKNTVEKKPARSAGETTKKAKAEAPVVKVFAATSSSYRSVIIRPRITEKATMKAEQNVYTFDVEKSATKASVSNAIHTMFKVTPVKVAIVPIRAKEVFARGKKGATQSGKKAYVYLKEGDKIEFV